MDVQTSLLPWIGVIGTLAAAGWALFVFARNSKIERAKWLSSLYDKFYEKQDLKPIRQIMDSDEKISLEITRLVRDESSEFTDYLNFFEFVAFLWKSRQLRIDEIDDLFGYYLDCLARREDIRNYLSKRGYELLARLLDQRNGPKK